MLGCTLVWHRGIELCVPRLRRPGVLGVVDCVWFLQKIISSVSLPRTLFQKRRTLQYKTFLARKAEKRYPPLCYIGRQIPGDGRVMEAQNVLTQSRISVEEMNLEVKAEGVVLASRRGESRAVIDEVNIEYSEMLEINSNFVSS